MDQAAKLKVYQAQVDNVRSLKTAMRQVHRSINDGLRANDEPRCAAFTKMYALIFCGWAEANFSKVLHTPYGFDLDEIAQVQRAKSDGIASAWKKCVALGLRHLDVKRGNFKPNAHKKLDELINNHVFDPSLLRNKLAHGQWIIALNRDNDAIQINMTNEIQELSITKIESWIKCHNLLSELVENLIESPKKAFVRDWYQYVTNIEAQIIEAEGRTVEEHTRRLLLKFENTGARAKRGAGRGVG